MTFVRFTRCALTYINVRTRLLNGDILSKCPLTCWRWWVRLTPPPRVWRSDSAGPSSRSTDQTRFPRYPGLHCNGTTGIRRFPEDGAQVCPSQSPHYGGTPGSQTLQINSKSSNTRLSYQTSQTAHTHTSKHPPLTHSCSYTQHQKHHLLSVAARRPQVPAPWGVVLLFFTLTHMKKDKEHCWTSWKSFYCTASDV